MADSQIIPKIGHIKLTDLTAGQVERWLEERSEHLTSKTLGIIHGLLKRAIRRVARHDKIGRNVAELVDTPAGRARRRSRSLTVDQAEVLLKEATKQEHRLGAYIILAIVSGLRTEELRTLRWSDVDLESATVFVLRAERHQGRYQDPAESLRSRHSRRRGGGSLRAA